MKGRIFLRAALLLIAGMLMPLSSMAGQVSSSHIPPTNRLRMTMPEASSEDIRPQAAIDRELRGQSGQLGIVIELNGAPTAAAFAQAQPSALAPQAAKAQLALVDQSQQRLLAPLASLGATVLYRTQRVYNGIAAHVDASQLNAIARLPGVKSIHRLVRHQRDLASSVPLIGAPALWAGTGLPGSLTGTGIKVAIIDTGVDYIHTGFGGSGTEADYSRNDTTTISEAGLFPSARVVAGYDFSGDSYNGANTPHPDPDPMDCNGHGSHVAGITAGNGVKANGTAYTGPYDASIYGAGNFKIGPGVAPQASIVALRVFGCDGSTELVNQALEWAVDPNGDGNFADRVDVINMSLGSDFGSTLDPTSVAADNAVLAGVVVVASAGNDGNTNFITGSPATSPRVISVASSADATDILDGFRVNSPGPVTAHPASNSMAFNWASSTPITGTLVYPPSQATGCQAFSSTNAALISGKIVLLDWTDGECGSVTRGANAVAAGAIGAILVDSSQEFDLSITGSATIPMVSTPKAVGDTLKGLLGGGAVSVTLSAEYTSKVPFTDPNVIDTVSSFSSRGPRRNGSALKPDISAPGQAIFSVGALSGTEGVNISGTSMAAPHVAGAMALLRQQHPTWTTEELKALAMNTAANNLRSGLDANAALHPVTRIGAGRIDLPRAAAGNVIALDNDAPGLVSVSFGNVEVLDTATATRKIQVVNKGSSAATYNLAYVPITTIPGVSYTLSATSVTVAAGQTALVDVTMNATAASMKHVHDVTISETQPFGAGQLSRPWLSEASGYVVLTNSGLAVSNFTAMISASEENPPTSSTVTASGVFTYTAGTGNIQYRIDFSKPITLTMAHFHSRAAGLNGPVVVPITTGDNTFGPGDPLSGNATLTAALATVLQQGGLYVNFHTSANPGGEIRGQVVPALADTALRVPVYASARPVSNMHATQTTLSTTVSSTIVLTGTGVNTGNNLPFDTRSMVSAFELQYTSPNEASSAAVNDKADLAYVGVASDVKSSSLFTETAIYFGLATHGDWSTPNEVEFDIYIDTDRDGTDDFVLFHSNSGLQSGQDQNEILLTYLLDLNTDDLVVQDYINGQSPGDLDTGVFNTNVMVLPVYAADLGLTAANSKFNYYVVSLSLDATTTEPGIGGAIEGIIDQSGPLTYDAANPGLDTTEGFAGVPMYVDLADEAIGLDYNTAAFVVARSQGVLLLHHHNRRGSRVEVIRSASSVIHLPAIQR